MNYRILISCLLVACLFICSANADTTLFYPADDGSTDGFMLTGDCGVDSTYEECRGQATGTDEAGTTAYVSIQARIGTDDWYRMGRGWLELNTSSLDDDITIDNATLHLAGYNKDNSLGAGTYSVTGFSPATPGSIAAGDFDSFGDTVYSSNITYADWDTSYTTTYNHFVFNTDGKNAISKTGWTNLMIRDTYDIDNVNGWVWANYLISSIAWISGEYNLYRPYLEVEWTAGGGDPPVASFSCDHTFLRIPQPVTCTDTSTETPTSWNWSFGDGTYSTDENPVHKYTRRGAFNVTLTATNDDGSDESDITEMKVTGYDTHT